jgi:hypothetical protein
MVLVRDMVVGNRYLVNGVAKTLTTKELAGRAGAGYQDPYFKLVFDNDETTSVFSQWYEDYKQVNSGGKRGSRRNRTNRKHKKKCRKTCHRRR